MCGFAAVIAFNGHAYLQWGPGCFPHSRSAFRRDLRSTRQFRHQASFSLCQPRPRALWFWDQSHSGKRLYRDIGE